MKFFRAIEGLDGENLASGILGYLLVNFEPIRRALLSELLETSGNVVADPCTHCECRTEVGTRDTEGAPGRLDIFVETDTVVIGIENKFLAAFSRKQPGKYIHYIRKRAEALSDRHKGNVKPLLVVLVPEARKSDVETAIHDPNYVDQTDRDMVSVVTWEELLKKMENAEASEPVATFLVEHLRDYVLDSTGSLKWLANAYSALKNRRSSFNVDLC